MLFDMKADSNKKGDIHYTMHHRPIVPLYMLGKMPRVMYQYARHQ